MNDTQAQIGALQSHAATAAHHLHALTEAYQQASLQASSLSQQLTTDNATLESMRAKLRGRRATLRNQAIRSYTGTHAQNSYSTLGGSGDPAVRAEYLVVASGDVNDSVDQLKVQQLGVQAQTAMVSSEQQANIQALRAAARARSSALALANAEQVQLNQLQTMLATQVATRQAAQTAATQAGSNQAGSAQTTPSHRTSSTTTAAAGGTSPVQGAPVNGGLVSTIVRVVGPPSPSGPPSSAHPPVAASPAPPPPIAPPPAPPASTPPASGGGYAGGNWSRLRSCESGDNYQENTGNGFYGAYQFSESTWSGLGYPGRPDQEPPAMQDAAAMKLQADSGWGQWPACSAALGLS